MSSLTTTSDLPSIPCCLCGILILSNAANQCAKCLSTQFDLSSTLDKSNDLSVSRCKRCLRYESATKNGRYDNLNPESKELLALCLRQIPAFNQHGNGNVTDGARNLKLLDAGFVWTEPHSKRIKLKLTVTADVMDGAISIQQRCMVELKEKNKECVDCHKNFTNQTWMALVQLRQKRNDQSSNKKGLLNIEMALSKSPETRKLVIDIQTSKNGFDFYFKSESHAQTFVNYLSKFSPTRTTRTKKLVSTDNHSNTANIKTTITVEMVPLCKFDLVLLDKRITSISGNLKGRLALVSKVSSTIKLITASPGRNDKVDDITGDMQGERYWKNEEYTQVYFDSSSLVEFIVLDVEKLNSDNSSNYNDNDGEAPLKKNALKLIECTVARTSDFGFNDQTYDCISHLGHLLSPGDTVLGYDLANSSRDDAEDESRLVSNYIMPAVVLVKKVKGAKIEAEPVALLPTVDNADANANNADGGSVSGKVKRKTRKDKKAEEASKDGYQQKKEKKGRGYMHKKKVGLVEGQLKRMGFGGEGGGLGGSDEEGHHGGEEKEEDNSDDDEERASFEEEFGGMKVYDVNEDVEFVEEGDGELFG